METYQILLAILAFALVITGLIGCIVPVIPGPPISYGGLVALHFTPLANYSPKIFIVLLILVIIVTVLDYIFPIIGTKKFGGTKRGIWGATIGLLVGLFFFPPWGIIIGTFAGALIGELTGGMKWKEALIPSLGSLAGVLIGIVGKVIISGLILYYVAKDIIAYVFWK